MLNQNKKAQLLALWASGQIGNHDKHGESSVKNGQVPDLESGMAARSPLGLPEIASAEGIPCKADS
jgi:hypothetical protein